MDLYLRRGDVNLQHAYKQCHSPQESFKIRIRARYCMFFVGASSCVKRVNYHSVNLPARNIPLTTISKNATWAHFEAAYNHKQAHSQALSTPTLFAMIYRYYSQFCVRMFVLTPCKGGALRSPPLWKSR